MKRSSPDGLGDCRHDLTWCCSASGLKEQPGTSTATAATRGGGGDLRSARAEGPTARVIRATAELAALAALLAALAATT